PALTDADAISAVGPAVSATAAALASATAARRREVLRSVMRTLLGRVRTSEASAMTRPGWTPSGLDRPTPDGWGRRADAAVTSVFRRPQKQRGAACAAPVVG